MSREGTQWCITVKLAYFCLTTALIYPPWGGTENHGCWFPVAQANNCITCKPPCGTLISALIWLGLISDLPQREGPRFKSQTQLGLFCVLCPCLCGFHNLILMHISPLFDAINTWFFHCCSITPRPFLFGVCMSESESKSDLLPSSYTT